MTDTVSASSTITASAQSVFAVLADQATHPAIDVTGWVREYLDTEKLAATGQIFRMAMYHENHPDGHYQMANRVEVVDPPHLIAWKPVARIDRPDGGTHFQLPTGPMIKLLRESGFLIDELTEFVVPADAHSDFEYVSPEWASTWPSVEVWKATRQ